jgi:hypothetical protein
MEATCSSEMSVDFQRNPRRYIPEDRTFQKYNIKMDPWEIGWGGTDWINLAQDSDHWGLLWIRQWTFGIHKMLGISGVGEQVVASQEGLSSMVSVS